MAEGFFLKRLMAFFLNLAIESSSLAVRSARTKLFFFRLSHSLFRSRDLMGDTMSARVLREEAKKETRIKKKRTAF